jgi:hypothetical protein
VVNGINDGIRAIEPAGTALWRHCYTIVGPYELQLLAGAERLLPHHWCACFIVDTDTGNIVSADAMDRAMLDEVAEIVVGEDGGKRLDAMAQNIQEIRRRLCVYFAQRDNDS